MSPRRGQTGFTVTFYDGFDAAARALGKSCKWGDPGFGKFGSYYPSLGENAAGGQDIDMSRSCVDVDTRGEAEALKALFVAKLLELYPQSEYASKIDIKENAR